MKYLCHIFDFPQTLLPLRDKNEYERFRVTIVSRRYKANSHELEETFRYDPHTMWGLNRYLNGSECIWERLRQERGKYIKSGSLFLKDGEILICPSVQSSASRITGFVFTPTVLITEEHTMETINVMAKLI